MLQYIRVQLLRLHLLQGMFSLHLQPLAMQRCYRLGGGVGLQALQISAGLRQGLLRCRTRVLCLCYLGAGARGLALPVVDRLQLHMLLLQICQRRLQLVGLHCQIHTCGGIQQLHALGLRLLLFQRLACIACTLKYRLRDLPVDFGARQLFQQFRAVVGAGIQKCRKATLCQQHGLGEAAKV